MPSAIAVEDVRAPKPVAPATKTITRPDTPIPQYLIDEAKQTVPEPFNAEKHLNYHAPGNILKMADIGLAGQGVSPHAASDPFRLFTKEAVMQMRHEIFSEETLNNCQYSSTFIKHMVRGMNHE